MAMEIVTLAPSAQNNALSSLLNSLGSGRQTGALLKGVTILPSGEAKLNLAVAGQTVELGASKEVAAQLTTGGPVVLKLIQTEKGPQLTIQSAETSSDPQNSAPNTGKGALTNNPDPSTRPQAKLPQTAVIRTEPNITSHTQLSATPKSYTAQPSVATASSPLQEAFVSLQRQSMAQQQSLTSLFANISAFLQQVETGQRPKVPQDIEVALRWVLGFQVSNKQLDGSQKAGEALRQVVASLGLLGNRPTEAGTKDITTNLKAALGLLRALLPDDGQEPLPPLTGVKRDQPPLRGAKLQGQSPQPPTLQSSDPDSVALSLIRRNVDAALARVTLTQIASLRPALGEGATTGGTANQALHAEIPVALPNGTAIVQMTVQFEEAIEGNQEDDPENESKDKNRNRRGSWFVQFAVEAEPVGPVDVSVRLRDETVGITLFAERKETCALFRETAPELQTILEAAGLSVDGLLISEKTQETSPPDNSALPINRARLDRVL